jgi:cytochrome oxidase Cu insertion factor (SCO1/SenC/PrrC family)
MKTRLLLAVLATALTAFTGLAADGKSGDKKNTAKSPADLAYEEFMKLVADKAKLAQPHFKQVTAAGIAFLTKNPTHARAADAVRVLGDYPTSMLRDKPLAAQRPVYIATLKYDVLDARIMADSDEAKTALAALDAAAADADMRETGTGASFESLREKIDALAPLPGSDRFLADRERSYYNILAIAKGKDKAGAYLQALLASPDKKVAAMARQELDLLEVSSAPYELKFTALDGREVDFAKLRGKVVALYFWSSTNGNSTRQWEALKTIQSDYRKKGFEIVTVSFDKEADREKLLAHVKQNGIKWPVYFDGQGNKSEFATKLAATSVPRVVIFDQKGIMKSNNLQVAQLEPAVKQLLATK